MFRQAFTIKEYRGEDFETGDSRSRRAEVLHYDLKAYGFRVSCNGKTMAYSGDSGPSDELAELARDADLFLCEATLLEPNPEGGTRGHLAADEAKAAFDAAGAKRLLLTARRSVRSTRSSSKSTTGSKPRSRSSVASRTGLRPVGLGASRARSSR